MDARLPKDEAWSARCLLRAARSATLATQVDGQPFASLITPATTPDGAVLMLLSAMSAHFRHLAKEPRCAILVQGAPTDLNPQTAPRLTVTGQAERLEEGQWTDQGGLRGYWLARHPYARLYADFADFALWRVVPQAGLYVAGFARATNLAAADFSAPPDAASGLAEAGAEILHRCNHDHADTIARLAHAQGAHGRWLMIGVDCDGFDLLQDETVLRIAFDWPSRDAGEVRAALVRMGEATRHLPW